MHRARKAKVVATVGPASTDESVLAAMFKAGVDVFRLNFSHGSAETHRATVATLRRLEVEQGVPIGILVDLQGPKLRIGTFADGPVALVAGQTFHIDLDPRPGNAQRVNLPHPEIFKALKPGTELLLDDGKLRLLVERCEEASAVTTVMVGGRLSERKGVNVPGVVLPISALTEKDLVDLKLGLELGADWIALSFVQRVEDVVQARALVGERASILTKLEKPSAIEELEDIILASDAVMVARGDLGVELPAEQVPGIQLRTIRACRRLGRPVVVATQMLESMVESPVPTRAEASDVATAVYDGADAVMLSAESAVGRFPVAAVSMMNRILEEVERDALYRNRLDEAHLTAPSGSNIAEVICCAMRDAVQLLPGSTVVCFTSSGRASLRASRFRPAAAILSLTPHVAVARRLAIAWGVHPVVCPDVRSTDEMVEMGREVAVEAGFAQSGQPLVIVAGVPFGHTGTTNMVRLATA